MIKDFREILVSSEQIKDLNEAEFDAAIAEGVTIFDFWPPGVVLLIHWEPY